MQYKTCVVSCMIWTFDILPQAVIVSTSFVARWKKAFKSSLLILRSITKFVTLLKESNIAKVDDGPLNLDRIPTGSLSVDCFTANQFTNHVCFQATHVGICFNVNSTYLAFNKVNHLLSLNCQSLNRAEQKRPERSYRFTFRPDWNGYWFKVTPLFLTDISWQGKRI